MRFLLWRKIHLNTASGNGANSAKGRFTLAHELGHYFIDQHRMALINGTMQPHYHTYSFYYTNRIINLFITSYLFLSLYVKTGRTDHP